MQSNLSHFLDTNTLSPRTRNNVDRYVESLLYEAKAGITITSTSTTNSLATPTETSTTVPPRTLYLVVMQGVLVTAEQAKFVCSSVPNGSFIDLDNPLYLEKAIAAMHGCSQTGQYHWFNSQSLSSQNKCYAIDAQGTIVERNCKVKLPVICALPNAGGVGGKRNTKNDDNEYF